MTDWTFNNLDNFNKYLTNQLPWYPIFCEGLLKQIFKEYATLESVVYDLGASLGNTQLYNQLLIEQRKINFTALEINREMINNYLAKKTYLVEADIRRYDYKNFNLATCLLVLSFLSISDRQILLKKLKSKCVKGGAILILDKFFPSNAELMNLFQKTTWQLKLNTLQENIVEKNLSLSGIQKQFTEKELIGFNKVFQYGEFSAYLYIKP